MTLAKTTPSPILVVDDAPENRCLLRHILESKGYAVEECQNGVECLKRCNHSPLPALIILDIMMPEMDGFDTCKHLRGEYGREELPILVASALTENTEVSKAISLGANDYVTKPLDRASLLARVESHVSLSATYKKQREQSLMLSHMLEVQRAIGDVLPEALFVQDASGNIIYKNKSAVDALSGNAHDTVHELMNNIYDGALSEVWRSDLQPLAEKADGFECEYHVGHHLFSDIQVRTRRVDLHEQCRVWLLEDMTHTRQLEDKMRVQIQLESVSTFVRGVAHNFNNILLSVMSASSLLAKWLPKEQKVENCLSMIQKAAEGGSRLTQKMMIMVRGPANSEKQAAESVVSVLELLIDVNTERYGSRCKFNLTSENNIPKVSLNVRHLSDIFSNVINNAIESISDEGNISIDVKKSSKETVIITISDNGAGMDQATLRRVFEPFFSTKNMDAAHGVSVFGNGLGMWNAYNLVRTFEGDISITSEYGKGTTVTIELPCVIENQESALQILPLKA